MTNFTFSKGNKSRRIHFLTLATRNFSQQLLVSIIWRCHQLIIEKSLWLIPLVRDWWSPLVQQTQDSLEKLFFYCKGTKNSFKMTSTLKSDSYCEWKYRGNEFLEGRIRKWVLTGPNIKKNWIRGRTNSDGLQDHEVRIACMTFISQ